MTPQLGQLLWVEAMSNPHSGQNRPPVCSALQLGQRSPPGAEPPAPEVDPPRVAALASSFRQSLQRSAPEFQQFSHTARSQDGQMT